jgi:predicted DNA-binding protein (MmcQ/YjbR family)
MTVDILQNICRALPGVTEDIKWEDHLCFNIGGKMFIVTAPDVVPVSASFKVPAEVFEEMAAKPGFKPAQYLARYHWVWIDDISRLSKKEWETFINQSYTLIAAKLPQKIRNEFGLIT